MANNATIQPAADLQALPLEMIIATPLTAAVKAQKAAADATVGFIQSMLDKNGNSLSVNFKYSIDDKGVSKTVDINVPILTIVPVPHLRIDSMTIDFKYSITQTFRDTSETDYGLDLTASTGSLLSPWVSATLKGSVSSKATSDSLTNRSGELHITVNASEAEIPKGLAKILDILAESIPAPKAT